MAENILYEASGLSSSRLKKATASIEDVVSGKTFYAGDKELKTGTKNASFTHVTFTIDEASSVKDNVTQNTTTNQAECTRYTWNLTNKIPLNVCQNLILGTNIVIEPQDSVSVSNAWTDGSMSNAVFKMNKIYEASTGTLSMTGKFYKTYSKSLSFGGWVVHVYYN